MPAKLYHCTKKFSGPSTVMEQDIIVEGFEQSLVQHGVIYKYFIGDRDSSVYERIVEKAPCGRQVLKIECANHMPRCASDKLHKLISNTKYPIKSRKILTENTNNISRLERLMKGIWTAIKNNYDNSVTLREDLANAPYHVLRRHLKCRNTFCNPVNQEEDLVNKIDSTFFIEIKKIV